MDKSRPRDVRELTLQPYADALMQFFARERPFGSAPWLALSAGGRAPFGAIAAPRRASP